MNRTCFSASALLAGLLAAAPCALPQGYTISARPGGINYVEGHAFVNDRPISNKGLRAVFLGANDTLSTDLGKAELLLTPGVYLRLGDNSAVKMISPSLTDTQVEVTRGEAMLEAAGLLKDNSVVVLDRGATVKIDKNGLYRFIAADPPSVAVLDGKAQVAFDGRAVQLGKDHEATLDAALKSEKFDKKQPDELYAWSNVRSQYNAASSYQTAKNVSTAVDPWWSFGNGFNSAYGSGWFWDGAFGNWAYIPAYGAYYSPFGYGFYAPGSVLYAPVVYAPVRGGATTKAPTMVPVNPAHPPAIGAVVASPAALQSARMQTARAYSNAGFSTAGGTRVAPGGGYVGRASAGAGGVSGGHASSGGFSGGGFSGGHAAGGGFSGGHMAGGTVGGGAHR